MAIFSRLPRNLMKQCSFSQQPNNYVLISLALILHLIAIPRYPYLDIYTITILLFSACLYDYILISRPFYLYHYTNILIQISLLLYNYLCIRESICLGLYPWIHMDFIKSSILFVRSEVQRYVCALAAYDMAE